MSRDSTAAMNFRWKRTPAYAENVSNKTDDMSYRMTLGLGVKVIQERLPHDLSAREQTVNMLTHMESQRSRMRSAIQNSWFASSLEEFRNWLRCREHNDFREPPHESYMYVDWNSLTLGFLAATGSRGFSRASLYKATIVREYFDDGAPTIDIAHYYFDTYSPERPTIMDIFMDNHRMAGAPEAYYHGGMVRCLECHIERLGSRTSRTAYELYQPSNDNIMEHKKLLRENFPHHTIDVTLEAHIGLYRWTRGSSRPMLKGVENTIGG